MTMQTAREVSAYSDSHHLVERLNRLLVIFHCSPYFVDPATSTYILPLLIQVAGLSLHLMQERQIPPDALVILSPSNVPLLKSLTSRKTLTYFPKF